jgi:hypothetical protein
MILLSTHFISFSYHAPSNDGNQIVFFPPTLQALLHQNAFRDKTLIAFIILCMITWGRVFRRILSTQQFQVWHQSPPRTIRTLIFCRSHL